MPAVQEDEAVITSDLSTAGDVPFGEDPAIDDDAEYAEIMRRIAGGEPGTSVSAFNSSI